MDAPDPQVLEQRIQELADRIRVRRKSFWTPNHVSTLAEGATTACCSAAEA
jgi:hypothetical protein